MTTEQDQIAELTKERDEADRNYADAKARATIADTTAANLHLACTDLRQQLAEAKAHIETATQNARTAYGQLAEERAKREDLEESLRLAHKHTDNSMDRAHVDICKARDELIAAQADVARLRDALELVWNPLSGLSNVEICERIHATLSATTTPQDIETVRSALENLTNAIDLVTRQYQSVNVPHWQRIRSEGKAALAILTNGKAAL